MKQASKVHRSVGPRDVRAYEFASDAAERNREIAAMIPNLHRLGISGLTPYNVERMFHDHRAALMAAMDGSGMDAGLQPSITTPNITTPIQFLQNWLPGFVYVITGARNIDDFVGMDTVGAWEDEEIVQGTLEQLGTSVPYGDYTNVPLSSWNADWERRTVVRFEEGMRDGVLENARASRVNINSSDQKREAATLALEIQRNYIGFYGYNNGENRTYGFLNDPGLPSAVEFAATGTGSSPLWSAKNFEEITADVRAMVVALRSQSQDTIDPKKTNMTLALATDTIDYLTVTTDFGQSVQGWIDQTYPKMRCTSAPELNGAIMGDNAAFLFAETVNDTSTDNKRTWTQMVPAKFRLIGVEQRAKAYLEDYSNASAGLMLKRPYAVVVRYGN